MHAKPQETPSQVAVALPGTGHARQEAPQLLVLVFETHAPPQRWNPALHTNPHDEPSHVEVEFAGGAGHGTHDVPHELTLLLLTHPPPQGW